MMKKLPTYPFWTDTDGPAVADEISFDLNETRHHCEFVAKLLMEEKGKHFVAKKDRRAKGPVLHASFVGASMLSILQNPLIIKKELRVETELNPFVKCILKNIEKSGLEQLPAKIDDLTEVELRQKVNMLNDYVARVTSEINGPDIQAESELVRKLEVANFHKLINNTRSIFDSSTTFALYHASFQSHDYRPDVPTFSDAPPVGYHDVIDIIKSMIKFFQEGSWSQAYRGCAWTQNYFYRDRYSIDFLIFLDEVKIAGDGAITRSLSNHWHEKSGGMGRFTGSSFRGYVVTPNGDSFCSDKWIEFVAKKMTNLTHSVLEMANEQGATQGIDSMASTS